MTESPLYNWDSALIVNQQDVETLQDILRARGDPAQQASRPKHMVDRDMKKGTA